MGGLFGIIDKHSCANDLFYGTDYNSHMGTYRGGMTTYNNGGFYKSIHNLENSYFRTKFEDKLDKFVGNSGIGAISDTDPQPIVLRTHIGKFALATIAKINNAKEIESFLLSHKQTFTELSFGISNLTELTALLISLGDSYLDGIQKVYNTVKGSCTMLLLTEDGIIAARDKYGRTPLIIGKKESGYAVTSESCGFSNLGFTPEYYLGPEEVVLIKNSGYTILKPASRKLQICSFLWVYYGFPTSCYEAINADEVRRNLGHKLAQNDNIEADFVAPIPESGVGCAIGYAEARKLPFRYAISKYTPTWARSFMPTEQTRRELVAKMKLIPNENILRGKKGVFVDDSIVRGTQLRDNVELLKELGVNEIHLRISCPPLLYVCEYVNFSASKSEYDLITRRIIRDIEGSEKYDTAAYLDPDSKKYQQMVEIMRKHFDVASIRFNSVENLVDAVGLNKNKICTHCFDHTSFGE